MPYYTSEPRIMAPLTFSSEPRIIALLTFSKANHIFLLFLMLNRLCAAIEDAFSPSPFEDAASPQALALSCSAAVPMPSLLNMGAHAGRGDNNNAKPHKKALRGMPRLLPKESRPLACEEAELALGAPDESGTSAADLILEGMDSALERVCPAGGAGGDVEFVSKPWLHKSRIANVKKALEEARVILEKRGSRLDVKFAILVNRFSPKNDNFRHRVIKALANVPAHKVTPTFIEMVESYSVTQHGGALDGYSVAFFIDVIGKFEVKQLETVKIEFVQRKERLILLPPIERDRLLNRLHEIFVVRELHSTEREQSLIKSRNITLLTLPPHAREEFLATLFQVFLKNAIEMEPSDAIAAEIDRTTHSSRSWTLVHSR